MHLSETNKMIKTYVTDSISSKYVLRTTFFRVITQF